MIVAGSTAQHADIDLLNNMDALFDDEGKIILSVEQIPNHTVEIATAFEMGLINTGEDLPNGKKIWTSKIPS